MYQIIQYYLDLGSYQRLDTGIIVAIINYSGAVITRVSGVVNDSVSQGVDS